MSTPKDDPKKDGDNGNNTLPDDQNVKKPKSATEALVNYFGANTESAKDPVSQLADILTNEKLTDSDKAALATMSLERFRNRRRMAYASIYSIIGVLLLLLLASFIDGFNAENNNIDITGQIQEITTLLTWSGGFLTGIVALYYGAATLRPSS